MEEVTMRLYSVDGFFGDGDTRRVYSSEWVVSELEPSR